MQLKNEFRIILCWVINIRNGDFTARNFPAVSCSWEKQTFAFCILIFLEPNNTQKKKTCFTYKDNQIISFFFKRWRKIGGKEPISWRQNKPSHAKWTSYYHNFYGDFFISLSMLEVGFTGHLKPSLTKMRVTSLIISHRKLHTRIALK